MAEIQVTGDTLVIHVRGADRIWALKSQLEIPLEHVVSAEIDPQVVEGWNNWWKGWRAPGTQLPGVIVAGTFYLHGEKIFWDVHHPEKAITIRLAHETYQQLIVEVDDPAQSVEQIQRARATRRGS